MDVRAKPECVADFGRLSADAVLCMDVRAKPECVADFGRFSTDAVLCMDVRAKPECVANLKVCHLTLSLPLVTWMVVSVFL
jgi:hypothetical protein